MRVKDVEEFTKLDEYWLIKLKTFWVAVGSRNWLEVSQVVASELCKGLLDRVGCHYCAGSGWGRNKLSGSTAAFALKKGSHHCAARGRDVHVTAEDKRRVCRNGHMIRRKGNKKEEREQNPSASPESTFSGPWKPTSIRRNCGTGCSNNPHQPHWFSGDIPPGLEQNEEYGLSFVEPSFELEGKPKGKLGGFPSNVTCWNKNRSLGFLEPGNRPIPSNQTCSILMSCTWLLRTYKSATF